MHEPFARENRGRRECRVPNAPAASRAKKTKHTSVVTTVTPDSPGIPYAMVLTAYFVLSPVIGLYCHRHPADMALSAPGRADLASAGLDAGVEASGPHDFAVRVSAVRQLAVRSLTGLINPPCHHVARPNAAASTASRALRP